ncbi:MAG: zinc ribbon domain-containing protein [Pyrinomonadaceae bacterium]|nr:zinc ribbon domain-containing protein [Pyrinomonadaceae bacterium]
MYCQSCGTSLATQMKYCNRCGAHLVTTKENDRIKLFEKRMDSEMEGLFWITVLGLGLILGGIALPKKVQLSESLIIAYLILSSAAVMAYFGLGVWQVRRLNRSSKEDTGSVQLEEQNTNELGPAAAWPTLEAGSSITEQTTRGLDGVPRDRVT